MNLSPSVIDEVTAMLDNEGIPYTIALESVGRILQDEQTVSRSGGFDSRYHRLGEVGIKQISLGRHSKTSFEKNCFSACTSTLNMGLINKVDMVCLSPVGYGERREETFRITCNDKALRGRGCRLTPPPIVVFAFLPDQYDKFWFNCS